MRRVSGVLLALVALGCRGREERVPGAAAAHIHVQGGPKSGEPEAVGGGGERGRALYEQNCVPCHGADGTGSTPMARMMRVGNLADPATQARLTDEDVRVLVKGGRGRMPAFPIEGDDLAALVSYVRTLKR